MLQSVVLIAMAIAEEKATPEVLAKDKCHYIIQGAQPPIMRWLGQHKQCLKWESFSTYSDHLHALYLYREEVRSTFKFINWELQRDLAIVDKVILVDKFLAAFGLKIVEEDEVDDQ